MLYLARLAVTGVFYCGLAASAFAQTAAVKPKPDAQFGNWLYKTPDASWKKSEANGNLVFSIPAPPGDYCTLTLFADAQAQGDFATQFNNTVAADQKAKDTVKIEADSGAKPSKAAEGFDVLTRSLRSETSALHTLHMYIGGHSGDRFDLAAFQTTSEAMWKRFGAQASQFLMSLKLANSLPPGEVAQLLGTATQEAPPALPGFDDTPVAGPATLAPTAQSAAGPQTAPAPIAAPVAQTVTHQPAIPLNKSGIVVNNAVIQHNGKPVDGIKLSQHDTEIYTPSIAVAPNGTIHIAFVEKHRTTYALAVYHRSSSDGGKTWTEAKNLSEDMPNIQVGLCYALADAQGRVYIIWRAGLAVNFPATAAQGGAGMSNIVYRVLENGHWSKIKPVSPTGSAATQDDGALAYFATVDAAGHVQVIWNAIPDKWHPELTTTSGTYHQHNSGVGNGLVFQATIDGGNVGAPREIFLTPVHGDSKTYDAACDGLDSLNGYADSAGAAHFIAAVSRNRDSSLRNKSMFELIENGKIGPSVDLPDLSYHGWYDVPILLVDAEGKRHLLALYPAGEHPSIRDYLLGSDDEPTIIRQSAGVKGTVDGFEAYQGPNGHMIAIMQMNDTGDRANGETYVSTSDGHGWSTPVNVTNNFGRRSFASKQTSVASNVAIEKSYYPGRAAAAYDHDGHLLLLMINNEYGLFSSSAFGVELAGGSSSTPTLQFLRF